MLGVEKAPVQKSPPVTEGGSSMAIRYKIDLMAALKDAGYSTYKIRKDGYPVNQTALQRIREGKLISWEQLERVCEALNMQPGDIVEYAAE